MSRLTPDLIDGILAGIRAGKTTQIIHVETGVAVETIRYHAFRAGLVITSRYVRQQKADYWRRKRDRFWKRLRGEPVVAVAHDERHAELVGTAKGLRW